MPLAQTQQCLTKYQERRGQKQDKDLPRAMLAMLDGSQRVQIPPGRIIEKWGSHEHFRRLPWFFQGSSPTGFLWLGSACFALISYHWLNKELEVVRNSDLPWSMNCFWVEPAVHITSSDISRTLSTVYLPLWKKNEPQNGELQFKVWGGWAEIWGKFPNSVLFCTPKE